MANKKGVALAAMEKLLRDAGAQRVSEDAKQALKEALEAYASRLGSDASKYATHAGRKTIKAEDVRLALENAKQQ